MARVKRSMLRRWRVGFGKRADALKTTPNRRYAKRRERTVVANLFRQTLGTRVKRRTRTTRLPQTRTRANVYIRVPLVLRPKVIFHNGTDAVVYSLTVGSLSRMGPLLPQFNSYAAMFKSFCVQGVTFQWKPFTLTGTGTRTGEKLYAVTQSFDKTRLNFDRPVNWMAESIAWRPETGTIRKTSRPFSYKVNFSSELQRAKVDKWLPLVQARAGQAPPAQAVYNEFAGMHRSGVSINMVGLTADAANAPARQEPQFRDDVIKCLPGVMVAWATFGFRDRIVPKTEDLANAGVPNYQGMQIEEVNN